ncbi:MAG: ABC transporter ATP-binding protein [Chloroflexi bacterium]|nr:MAG: ABC transporter ATP-binding protein [Chloroflexota bacterium]
MRTASSPTTSLLTVSDLRVNLGGAPVLRGVGLTVAAGEVAGLLGPNGVGKTTLLRAISGVAPSAAGHVQVHGATLAALGRRRLAQMVAVVQQLPEAPPELRVEELVLLGRTPHLGLLARESTRDYAIARQAMRRAGCAMLAERALGTLSGGQRRRAFIARALAQEPALLLLDEPTANLDVQAQGETFELLRQLAAEGVGVLVAVHDLTLAAAYCDRVVLLHEGRIVAVGTPAEVITADIVHRVYGAHVDVIHHPVHGAPIVVPARLEATRDH